MTFLQTNTPKEKVGRISALYLVIDKIIPLYSYFSVTWLSDIKLIFLINSIAAICGIISLYYFTGIRKIKIHNYILDSIN
jgi:hypothetical protein